MCAIKNSSTTKRAFLTRKHFNSSSTTQWAVTIMYSRFCPSHFHMSVVKFAPLWDDCMEPFIFPSVSETISGMTVLVSSLRDTI